MDDLEALIVSYGHLWGTSGVEEIRHNRRYYWLNPLYKVFFLNCYCISLNIYAAGFCAQVIITHRFGENDSGETECNERC